MLKINFILSSLMLFTSYGLGWFFMLSGWIFKNMESAGKKWLYPILVLFPLGIFRFPFARIALKSVMLWKQLHMLSWVVFLTLALHALTAYVSLDGGDELVKPVWIYVFIVFSIHGEV